MRAHVGGILCCVSRVVPERGPAEERSVRWGEPKGNGKARKRTIGLWGGFGSGGDGTLNKWWRH